MYLLYFITIFIIYLACVVSGSQPGFEEFIKNSDVKELLSKYENKEIKTQAALHKKLEEAGIILSLRTLKTYLSKIKVSQIYKPWCIFFQNSISTETVAEKDGINVVQCYSKKDRKFLFLIGNGDVYRKFVKTNEHGDTIYLECLQCRALYEPNTER